MQLSFETFFHTSYLFKSSSKLISSSLLYQTMFLFYSSLKLLKMWEVGPPISASLRNINCQLKGIHRRNRIYLVDFRIRNWVRRIE